MSILPITVKNYTSEACERPMLSAFKWGQTCTTMTTTAAVPCSMNRTCSKGSKSDDMCGVKPKTPIVKLKLSDAKKKFTCRVKKLKYTPVFTIHLETSSNQWSEMTRDQMTPLVKRGSVSGVRGKGKDERD